MRTSCLLYAFFFVSIIQGKTQILFSEGFENGIGLWSVSNGVFEVGEAILGDPSTYEGQQLAGTVLGGNYPENADTRLISPTITLPETTENQIIKLRFWHWFDMEFVAEGELQISNDNGNTWTTLSEEPFDEVSRAWTKYQADISGYEGQSIKIAFLFTSSIFDTSLGWYLDDITVEIAENEFPHLEGFEDEDTGNHWYASNGSWQIGQDDNCTQAYEGDFMLGTILNGNYPENANSRWISPEIQISSSANEYLRFWHWYNMEFEAEGFLQVSVNGGEWESIGGPFDDNSGGWTQFVFDNFSAYANQKIRLGFLFTSSIFDTECGWYIDAIELGPITSLVQKDKPAPLTFECIPNPFQQQTQIAISQNRAGYASLKIFGPDGRLCKIVFEGNLSSGKHIFDWIPDNPLPTGLYVAMLQTETGMHTEKIIYRPE